MELVFLVETRQDTQLAGCPALLMVPSKFPLSMFFIFSMMLLLLFHIIVTVLVLSSCFQFFVLILVFGFTRVSLDLHYVNLDF